MKRHKKSPEKIKEFFLRPHTSLELFQKMISLVPALIAVYNLQTGKYVYINDAFRKLLGYTKKDFVNKDILFVSSLVHPDDFPRIMEKNARALKVANSSRYRKKKYTQIVDFEYRMRHKNGKYRWFHSDGVVFDRDSQGKVLHVMNVSVDITKRKEQELSAERSLQQENRLLSAILDSATEGIIGIDNAGVCTFINNDAAKMLGYSPHELLGKDMHSRLHYKKPDGSSLPVKECVIHESFSKGKSIRLVEQVFWKKNGHPLFVLFSLAPLLENNIVTGAVVTFMDITERKKLERQKDDFLGVASHELKTPITSIKAYTQVLLNHFTKKGDEKSALLLSKMDTQLRKLTNLISDLLDVTKIEKGKMIFSQSYFDFNELVSEIVEEMQRTTDDHTIELNLGQARTIYGDRERIGQVMVNLLSNAIKYSPDSRKIIVHVNSEGEKVECSVEDFGIGIGATDKQKVFERFFRVSSYRHESFPGLGLGLFISSEIIRRHQGKIWVDTKKKKGSKMYFTLPIQPPKA